MTDPIFTPQNTNDEARDRLEAMANDEMERGHVDLASALASVAGLYAIAAAVIAVATAIDDLAEAKDAEP